MKNVRLNSTTGQIQLDDLPFLSLSAVDDEILPSKTTNTRKRSPSPRVIRSNDIPHLNLSGDSFDYARNARRCILNVDHTKGLGFVLSATGDYDHTITAVEKVGHISIRMGDNEDMLSILSLQ